MFGCKSANKTYSSCPKQRRKRMGGPQSNESGCSPWSKWPIQPKHNLIMLLHIWHGRPSYQQGHSRSHGSRYIPWPIRHISFYCARKSRLVFRSVSKLIFKLVPEKLEEMFDPGFCRSKGEKWLTTLEIYELPAIGLAYCQHLFLPSPRAAFHA